jgi:Integral membrane protein, interacts with FtsH
MSVVTDPNGAIVGLTEFGSAIYLSGLKWIVMLAPLGIVFYMSFGINKMSASRAQTTFWVFAALMGLSSFFNFTSLHRFECNKSILYFFSNFWCYEYIWLHNKKRLN